MATRTPLIVGGVLLASVAVGAIVMLFMPTPASRMTAALNDLRNAESAAQKRAARERMAELPADPSLRPVLVKALSDGNDAVREAAGVELRRVGLPADELLGSFTGKNRHLARFAERTLSNLGPEDESLVPGLLAGLESSDLTVKQRAIIALGGIGPAAAPAVPKLITIVREGDSISVQNAAATLGNIGPAAADAVPALVAIVREGSKINALGLAIEALGKIGESARSAVPLLFEHLKDTPAKGQTLGALSRLNASAEEVAQHMPLLQAVFVELTLTPDEFAAAARLLASQGEQARPIVPDLLRSTPTRASGDVIASLRQIDPEVGAAVEAANVIHQSPDDARAKVGDAVLKLGGRSILFVPFRMGWEEAREWCEARGGRLVSIHDAVEQNSIVTYARKFERSRMYSGASDRRVEGTFQWEDGSPWDFTNWLPGEPNNLDGGEHYGDVYLDTPEAFWNDSPGLNPYPFIIQWID